jgi:hypothetical protein
VPRRSPTREEFHRLLPSVVVVGAASYSGRSRYVARGTRRLARALRRSADEPRQPGQLVHGVRS